MRKRGCYFLRPRIPSKIINGQRATFSSRNNLFDYSIWTYDPTVIWGEHWTTVVLHNHDTSMIIDQLFTWSSCSSKLHLSKWWLWYVSFGMLSMYSSYCSIVVCLSRMPLDSSLSLLLNKRKELIQENVKKAASLQNYCVNRLLVS